MLKTLNGVGLVIQEGKYSCWMAVINMVAVCYGLRPPYTGAAMRSNRQKKDCLGILQRYVNANCSNYIAGIFRIENTIEDVRAEIDKGIPVIVTAAYADDETQAHSMVINGYDDESGQVSILDPSQNAPYLIPVPGNGVFQVGTIEYQMAWLSVVAQP